MTPTHCPARLDSTQYRATLYNVGATRPGINPAHKQHGTAMVTKPHSRQQPTRGKPRPRNAVVFRGPGYWSVAFWGMVNGVRAPATGRPEA